METSAPSPREKALESWLLLFFLFSTAGWLWEVLLTVCATGRWVNRGLLHGPWLPVYGTGGVLLAAALRKTGWSGLYALLTGAVTGGAAEYGVSWLLEAVYRQRWWDYSGWAGSMHGRVCLASLTGFALAGWLTALTAPVLLDKFGRLRDRLRRRACRAVSLLFALDWAVSLLRPNTGEGISFPL